MAMAEAVRAPQLLLPAGNDDKTYKAGGELMALLEGIPEIGASMGTRCYEEMSHGWSVRGDMSDPAVARDVASAFGETMAFLDRHLLA